MEMEGSAGVVLLDPSLREGKMRCLIMVGAFSPLPADGEAVC